MKRSMVVSLVVAFGLLFVASLQADPQWIKSSHYGFEKGQKTFDFYYSVNDSKMLSDNVIRLVTKVVYTDHGRKTILDQRVAHNMCYTILVANVNLDNGKLQIYSLDHYNFLEEQIFESTYPKGKIWGSPEPGTFDVFYVEEARNVAKILKGGNQ